MITTTTKVSQPVADAIVRLLGLDTLVVDSEAREGEGYVYILQDNNAVIVQDALTVILVDEDSQPVTTHYSSNDELAQMTFRVFDGTVQMYHFGMFIIDEQLPEIGDEACPGCGWVPGDGVNASCNHPQGCGYWKIECARELAAEEAAAE